MVALKISERLKSISEYVPVGSVIADIGTDHGYLLKYLLIHDKIAKGLACDLNKRPLNYAKNNLSEYIKNEKVELRLGRGLEPLKEEDGIECIVIAGMGGKTMVEILEKGKSKLIDIKRIILAPNARWEILRKYLVEEDFKIIDEDLVLEDNRFYPIIVIEKGNKGKLTPAELFLGPKLLEKKHVLLKEFFVFEKQGADKNIIKMEKSLNPETKERIEELKEKWKEMSRCLNEF